ncbi:TetR/AcrR family transcriptional regulator C-terminal ligand-binding domain-containing protein [Streptomyces sp. NRRL B-3648]|uniref:TetR/AcrR family transcriptional regulator C-terminal ligand-binding domain-containing protein n=1 Tax=Streptomyces sp. NRRL B-3648 TaxID=1519493 RepID=UPI001F2F32ED|nr:TetR/AcrR family transcriptional regulator C-terminal ligand-binding domain-containing protein [Streptomyces sp. NRRL B-3648]
MDQIAANAGVGQTTVHRRRGSPVQLATDLPRDRAERSLPSADTGSLVGDLQANADLVHDSLTDLRIGALSRTAITAAACHSVCAVTPRGFYRTRPAECTPVVTRLVDHGKLRPDIDAL